MTGPEDITMPVGSITMTRPPSPLGWWIVGGDRGLHIPQYHKPRWITRALMRTLVEWEWKDSD